MQGLGLFAARDIEKQTMVIEYLGNILRNEVAMRKELHYKAKVCLISQTLKDLINSLQQQCRFMFMVLIRNHFYSFYISIVHGDSNSLTFKERSLQCRCIVTALNSNFCSSGDKK